MAGASVCCALSAAAGAAVRRVTFVLRPLAVWIVAPVAMPTSSALPAKLKLKRLQRHHIHASTEGVRCFRVRSGVGRHAGVFWPAKLRTAPKNGTHTCQDIQPWGPLLQ